MTDPRNPWTDGEGFPMASIASVKHALDAEAVVSGLAVSSTAGENFESDVDSGEVWIDDEVIDVSSETLTHDTSDTNDRVDLISADSDGNLSITKGTEDTTSPEGEEPVAPDIPDDEVLIAAVHVRGGSDEIVDGDILDEFRTMRKVLERSATFELGGDFDAGSWATVRRTGGMVSFTSHGWLNHTDNNVAASTDGVIPEEFRPDTDVYNLTSMGSDFVVRLRVNSSGRVFSVYRDWSGSDKDRTSTGGSLTISYPLEGEES